MDTLTKELNELDADLKRHESDANADPDMLGNVWANLDVTGLRERVARLKGFWEAKRDARGMLESVLCDPDGNVCIAGSAGDKRIIAQALRLLGGEAA